VVELRLDPEPIERAAHERGLDTDAEHADIPAGLEPHLVERRRQHIPGHRPGRLVERLGPRQCRLAGGREGAHPQAQLLHARPRHGTTHLGDQADDPRVARRLVQRPQGRPQPVPAAAAQPGQGVVRLLLHRHLGEIQLEQDAPSPHTQRRHASHRTTSTWP